MAPPACGVRYSTRRVVLCKKGARVRVGAKMGLVVATCASCLTGEPRLRVEFTDGGREWVPVQTCQARRATVGNYADLAKIDCKHKQHVHHVLLELATINGGVKNAVVLDSVFMMTSKTLRRHFACPVTVPNPQAGALERVRGVRNVQATLGRWMRSTTATYDFAFLDFCGTIDTCESDIIATLPRLRTGAVLGITLSWRRLGGARALLRLQRLLERQLPGFCMSREPYLYRSMLFVCGRVPLRAVQSPVCFL